MPQSMPATPRLLLLMLVVIAILFRRCAKLLTEDSIQLHVSPLSSLLASVLSLLSLVRR